ncbi:TIGR00341 family protein [Methanospirillum stamsii]|uniref:TIGR00341 family protein n=1 Tax=Methanospirillum stamsii TaxID=1277351 RepID=A0A2V2MZS9_9EURY|nr:TIGR00341 family protein [Methanospirillum stamsii]PWR71840.1 TIGR00341 family protein [Methanospirillum stamsii]
MLENVIKIGRFDRSYLPELQEKVFFEGKNARRFQFNYFILLTLATIISTYGVISGSTATVIGAMIIAPLMTPIMATTLAIVLGDSKRTSEALGMVIISIFYVVFLAVLLSIWVSPFGIDFQVNQEITSRTSPDIFALFVALASGAAGAFAMSKKSISDSLPGVAIAISLVPPLSVVGISFAKGQWDDAYGSLLLFLTNFFAILVAGGAVLWISGVNPGWMDEKQFKHRKKTFIIAVVCTIIVAMPLFFSGLETMNHAKNDNTIYILTSEWLTDSSYHLEKYTFRMPNYSATIYGTGKVPPIEDLQNSIEKNLKTSINVEVRVIPETVLSTFPEI